MYIYKKNFFKFMKIFLYTQGCNLKMITFFIERMDRTVSILQLG